MTAECPREFERQSKYSPDRVHDEELIIYVLIEPDEWKAGRASKRAFDDRRLRKGDLSVSRRDHTTAQKVRDVVVAPRLARDDSRRLIGVLSAECAAIRRIAIGSPPRRAICVIDDGLENDPAHTVLSYSEGAKDPELRKGGNARLTIRANLTRVFGEPRDLEEVFSESA